MPKLLSWLLYGLALLCLAGCGRDGPETAAVSGTITLDGQPVPGAVITFFPDDPTGSPSYGGTDLQGNYKLMFTFDKSGAMIGKQRVEIETTKVSKRDAEEMQAEGLKPPVAYVAIPNKYREPGALTAEVKRGGNRIDFALTSQ